MLWALRLAVESRYRRQGGSWATCFISRVTSIGTRTAVHEHRAATLVALFDDLDATFQAELEEAYRRQPVVSGKRTIREALAVYDSLFVDARYPFEDGRGAGAKSITGLVELLRVIGDHVGSLSTLSDKKNPTSHGTSTVLSTAPSEDEDCKRYTEVLLQFLETMMVTGSRRHSGKPGLRRCSLPLLRRREFGALYFLKAKYRIPRRRNAGSAILRM
jgi:hypothetical protein